MTCVALMAVVCLCELGLLHSDFSNRISQEWVVHTVPDQQSEIALSLKGHGRIVERVGQLGVAIDGAVVGSCRAGWFIADRTGSVKIYGSRGDFDAGLAARPGGIPEMRSPSRWRDPSQIYIQVGLIIVFVILVLLACIAPKAAVSHMSLSHNQF